jgi:hypothetical protein
MPARDDAGSNYGRPGGSQNSGVNNGGVAGGMGGGFGGGGAGRMGGIGSRTGLTTGNTMFGGMAFGRPGGFAMNSSAFGVRPQAGIAQGPLSGARPRPAAVSGVNPAVEQEMALPTNPPGFMNNPFVDKPATIADYVRSVVKSYQGLNAPAAAAWTPAAPYDPAINSIPGYTNLQRGNSGTNWRNDRNNWPRGGVPGTRSMPSTNGGYPSLGSQDTRPAGVY